MRPIFATSTHINAAKIQISHNYAYVCKYKSSQNINTMKIKEEYELQRVCGEALLLPRGIEDVDEKEIINLDPVSEYLWERVATMESFTTGTLVELLMQEYDVDEERARADVEKFMNAVMKNGFAE